MLPLVSAEQMRALDADTISRLGISGALLMENAGRGVISALFALHDEGAFDLYSQQVVVVCGPGNNGGDGFVIARYLQTLGVAVRLCLCAERERVRGDALVHLEIAERCGLSVVAYGGEAGAGQVASLLQRLGRRDIIVDALLGTGVSKPVSGPLGLVIDGINRSPAIKIAVDLPSGLDADCGVPLSPNVGSASGSSGELSPIAAIVRADHTITLGLPKLGLCGAPGFTYAGAIRVVDIGIPESLCAAHGVRARLLDERSLLRLGQPRSPLGHKGSHGHLLIIAGSRGKSGAALLTTRAALRTGVGLCTLAAPSDVVDSVLGGHVVEAMSHPYFLPATEAGDRDGKKGSDILLDQLLSASIGKHALAIGPGLPTTPIMKPALLELLARSSAPAVLDADALNLLCGEHAALRAATKSRELVLTPHPGEAARLLDQSIAEVQADRTKSARRLCQLTGAVVVLKGARSVIVAPQNAELADEDLNFKRGPLSLSPTGNAGMGSGGMGDALTGMIGALLAAGWPAYEAACAAVFWHGLSGDLLMKARAPGSILLASELIDGLDAARKKALDVGPATGLRRGWPLSVL